MESDPARTQVNRRQNLSRYGLTPSQYDDLLASQDGCCAICGDPPDPNGVRAASRLHVDHCHETGRVRGLLCVRCNPALGLFHDRPGLLRAAADYLERPCASE